MANKGLDEFGLIRCINQPIYQPEMVRVGMGDDCAVLPYNDEYDQVITCDLLVEDVHFLRNKIPFSQLGFKAVAASLSDIAAMGASPTNILIAVAIPADFNLGEWQGFYQGVQEICEKYKVNLVGGDTTRSMKQIVINVTAMGLVKKGQARLRCHAKVGDKVFVTGALGASKAGLMVILNEALQLENTVRDYLLDKHCRPEPCCYEIEQLNDLAQFHLHALNDISDGLISECYEIAEASHVGIILNSGTIPIDSCVQLLFKQLEKPDMEQWAITSGEEYQLVGTMTAGIFEKVAADYENAMGKPLFCIGEVVSEKGVFLRTQHGLDLLKKNGYNHFNE